MIKKDDKKIYGERFAALVGPWLQGCQAAWCIALVSLAVLSSSAQAQNLGGASTFAVLGGSGVTNTGQTLINGDLGSSPSLSITGFPPGIVNGTVYSGAASLAGTAKIDALTVYNSLAIEVSTINLTGQDLGGMILSPGIYHFDTTAQLTGNLFLDTLGDPNAVFHFQIGSTLNAANFSAVTLLGGALTPNIFWQVGSSATLGIGAAFEGNILALTSITLTTGATISNGSAIAINGAVTLDSNTITKVGLALPAANLGTFWNGNTSNLWSEANWSTNLTGADTVNLVTDSDVVFSVTGTTPVNQNTLLDTNQTISSLTINDAAAVSISGPNTLTISGAGALSGIHVNAGAGLVTIGANVALAGPSQTITVNNTPGLIISGVLTGTDIVKAGAGQLTLTGENLYSGATNIQAGTLQIGDGVTGTILPGSLISISPAASLLISLAPGGVLSNQVVNNGLVQWLSPAANSQASTSVISGTGAMAITSPATTIILGTNTFGGGTTIDTSGVVLIGNPSGNVSTAFGTGILTLNNGLVDTLNNQVLQVNVGGFVQNGGQIGIHLLGTAPGTFTQYNVTGTATLNGGTVVLYDNSGTYVPEGAWNGNATGDQQNIIQTTVGLNGQFASNTPTSTIVNTEFNQTFIYAQGSTLLYPTITYDADSANVVWVRDSYTSLGGLTSNQQAVGAGLNGFAAVNPGNAGGALTFLNAQPLAALPAMYNLMAPEELTALFQTSFQAAEIQASNIKNHLEQVRDGARRTTRNSANETDTVESSQGGKTLENITPTSANAPAFQRRWNFFVEATGGQSNISADSNADGYDFTSTGGMIGADYLVSEHLAVGVMGGYASSDANLVNGGSIETDSYRGAIFASVFNAGFYLDGLVGLGHNSYDTERAALLGRASGSTEGLEFNALLNGGYDFRPGNWVFGPVASIAYTQVQVDGFTESGSLTPLRYQDQEQESLRSSLGAKVSYTIPVGSVRITPMARVTWQHEFMDSTQSIDSSFAAGPGPVFTVNGPEIGRDTALVTAGVSVQFNPAVAAYAFYTGQFGRSAYDAHTLTLGVRISF